MTGLNLGNGNGNKVAPSREGATDREQPEEGVKKPLETAEEVETRLNPTQPVGGDSNVASETPETVFRDPPTPAEERKDTLEGRRGEMETPGNEEQNNIERQQATLLADAGKESADDGVVRYSSHPILNYGIGRFVFENGLLQLRNDKDVKEFEETLESLPLSERARIKKLDLSAAEAQVRAVRAQEPSATKGIGSDTGNRDPGKQVGRGVLGE